MSSNVSRVSNFRGYGKWKEMIDSCNLLYNSGTPVAHSDQRYQILEVLHKDLSGGDSNWSTELIKMSYLETMTSRMLHVLSPLFALTRHLRHDSGKNVAVGIVGAGLNCLQQPALVMVEFSQQTQVKDIRDTLGQCATTLGVPLVTLDLRLFSHNAAAKNSPHSQHALASRVHAQLAHLGLFNQLAHASLSELSGDVLTGGGSCILHIEGADLLYAVPLEGGDSGRGASPGETQDEEFAKVFRVWLDELTTSIIARQREAPTSHDQCCVSVVVSTSSARKMSPSLRNLFPACVDMRESALNDAQLQTIVQTVCGPAIRGEEESSLVSHIQMCGGSHAAARVVLQETRLTELKTQRLSQWLHHTGLDAHLSIDEDRLASAPLPPAGSLVHSASLTASLVPCVGDSGSTVGSGEGEGSGGSKYSSNIAPVHWSDIGGLDRVRREILDVLELPLLHPHLFPPGCPRRQGVLLYGPPGTGKTLVAKAVATECKMAFISIKGPELLDSYVGESERNVRELFACARLATPCVLFFDEIDSLAPARARGHDSGGGVMDRIVSQLLTEIDLLGAAATGVGAQSPVSETSFDDSESAITRLSSLNSSGHILLDKMSRQFHSDKWAGETGLTTAPQNKSVFIIAATNRPDLLDPALLRPGRFDRKVYLGVCKDVSSRVQILQAQTRSFSLSQDVDLLEVAAALPDNVTGADIGSVTAKAFASAMTRKLRSLTRDALRDSDTEDSLLLETSDDRDDEEEEWDDSQCRLIRSHINAQDECALLVRVGQRDLLDAARAAVPTSIDLEYYEGLGRRYDDDQLQE